MVLIVCLNKTCLYQILVERRPRSELLGNPDDASPVLVYKGIAVVEERIVSPPLLEPEPGELGRPLLGSGTLAFPDPEKSARDVAAAELGAADNRDIVGHCCK